MAIRLFIFYILIFGSLQLQVLSHPLEVHIISNFLLTRNLEISRTKIESLEFSNVPEGWTLVGDIPRNERISISIAVKQRNTELLENILWDVSIPSSSSYGQYLTKEEIKKLTEPSKSSLEAIYTWLEETGIVSYKTLDSWFIEVEEEFGVIEKLLECQFHSYEHTSGSQLYRSINGYSVPMKVAPHVDFISGVFRFPDMQRVRVKNVEEKNVDFSGEPSTTPEFIHKLYNITVPPASRGNLQAVVSFLGQYYSPSDLKDFQKANNLPVLPIEKTLGPNDPSNPGVEASLDVQFLTGIAENVRTWVYSTSGQRPGGNEPFIKWLSNLGETKEVPFVFSISYQDLEYTVTPEFAARVNLEFLKHLLQGRTFFTGSGDWGVGCKDPQHCSKFTADFPSDSPWITSLGATYIQGNQEIGIGFSSGGFSNYFPQPHYQKREVGQFLQGGNLPNRSLFNSSGRAFPDLACIGHNFPVFINGHPSPVAGTSASTPTFASQVSLLNSLRFVAGLPPMGFVNPFLYQAAAQSHTMNPPPFKVIRGGDVQNHGCCPTGFQTGPTWTPYVGMGTPNWGVLAEMAMDKKLFQFSEKYY